MKLFVLFALIALFGCSSSPKRAQSNLSDFVMVEYNHGVPYSESQALGTQAVPELLEFLRDESMKRWHSNVVVTLGFIGDARAIDPLIDFVEKTSGHVDNDTFMALSLVPVALGDIGREDEASGNRVFQYLDGRTRPDGWNASRIAWWSEGYRGERLSRQLASSSIAGLGRLATNSASESLRKLRVTSGDAILKQSVVYALQTLDQIRSGGAAKALSDE